MVREIVGGLDETLDLDAAHDPIQIAAARRLELGEQVERAQPGGLLALLDGEVAADLAGVLHLAPGHGDLAGDEDQVAGHHVGNVVGDRGGRLGQLDVEFGKTRVDAIGHGNPPRIRV